jgi:hypothetical protein
MRRFAPVRLLALALMLTGLVALSAPAAGTAAKPCWRQIVDDWYDNERIDGSYSQACYREADENIPQDLRDYSDLPGEINRARLRDLRVRRVDPDQEETRRLQGAGPVDATNDPNGPTGGSGNSGDGFIGEALDELGPKSADSAPIPLLVLAGLALLLVAAGAAGLLTRKLSARRARTPQPPTQ